jgi:hypothetical protein
MIGAAMLSLTIATLLMTSPTGGAANYVAFDARLQAGVHCLVDVRALHPTQLAVGLQEIRMRAARLLAMKAHKQEKYLRSKEVPVVIGPGGVPYIVDRHHLVRLLLDTNLRAQAYAIVSANWSNLPPEIFWKRMSETHWLYLFDEHGKGPLATAALPKSVADLKDDPYRTLSWLVRERGGYAKTAVPFAEFQWANFFRARISEKAMANLEEAAAVAFKLAASPEAATLPGYTPTPLPAGEAD